MDPACLRHTDLPGASKLFGDFSYHYDRVANFYRHSPHNPASFAAAASEIQYPDDRRAAMARVLEAQNPGNGLVATFARPGTVAVISGQQVGLFSGPAYTIYKALTAVRLASDLSARGIPAVPIFWMATEDHDFAEVNHTWVFDKSQQPVRIQTQSESRPRPAGTVAIAQPPIDELRQALAGFEHSDEVVAAVEQAYRPGVTMGAGFRALLKKLLGQIGILTLDPLDRGVRSIGAPFMASALEAAPELKSALLDRNAELAAAGYHAQVHVDSKTSLFFLLENGERVALRQKDPDLAALSPNALLRPVWQDYLLPTVAYVGGPAELAYLAQSRVIYDRLLGRMPVVMARAGFTLVDARAAKLLERYGLSLTETLVPEASLKDRIARKLVPESLVSRFEHTSAEVERRLDQLGSELSPFDPTLTAALGKSRAKILYQLGKVRRKTEAEALRRDGRASAEAAYLSALLYPQGHLQERTYSILPFLAKHGMDLVDRLYDLVKVDCPDHRVVTL